MTQYRVDRQESDGGRQSWDILAHGDTYGPFPHDGDAWKKIWRWPNFTPGELVSRSDGKLMLYLPAIDALQKIRTELDRPLFITSAYRSPYHNELIGGSRGSRHLAGAAFDVAMGDSGRDEFVDAAKRHGFNGFGYYSTFVHIDFRAIPGVWRG